MLLSGSLSLNRSLIDTEKYEHQVDGSVIGALKKVIMDVMNSIKKKGVMIQ